LDADKRKQEEAQRLKDESDQRRKDRENNQTLHSISSTPKQVSDFRPVEVLHSEGDGLDASNRHITCPKCNESMRQSQLSHHMDKQCSRRRVMCPNYHNGCQQRLVPLFLLQTHLRSECAAEKHRDRMIAKAAQRRGKFCMACIHLQCFILISSFQNLTLRVDEVSSLR